MAGEKIAGSKTIDRQFSGGRQRRQTVADKMYPLLLVLFGCIWLTATGSWHVYTDALQSGGKKFMSAISASVSLWDGIRSPVGAADADANLNINSNTENMGDTDNSTGQQGSQPDGPQNGQSGGQGAGQEDETGPEGQKGVSYQTVEDDYFADAVFIGDSRTVGLFEYGGLEEISTFYASTGLTVHKLFSSKIVAVPGQKQKITVEEALTQNQFAKVYLMIGINEMGTGTPESFLEKYAECVAHIQELQPDAVIYLQSIMCVTDERSAQGDYITNEGINIRNEGIAAMADNERVFYLDVNQPVCDETGAMTAGYTYDGVHLKAQYIALWKDYLKCHAMALDVSP